MTKDRHPPLLGASRNDVIAAIGRSVLGAVPIAGTALTEIVTAIIPNQRMDRFEEYLRHLGEMLNLETAERLSEQSSDPTVLELIEEGGIQSARAFSEQRRQQIARVVTAGLNGDEREKIQARRILSIVGQLDDEQIILLCSYSNRFRKDAQFRETHRSVMNPVQLALGSSVDDQLQYAFREASVAKLFDLQLLRNEYPKISKTAPVLNFDDKTGGLKPLRRTVTSLGTLVLQKMGFET